MKIRVILFLITLWVVKQFVSVFPDFVHLSASLNTRLPAAIPSTPSFAPNYHHQSDEQASLYQQALQAVKKGHLAEGESLLRQLLKNNELFQSPSRRSVWFQLGRVLQLQKKSLKAIQTLEQGRKKLGKANQVDWYLNYHLVRMYSEHGIVERDSLITKLVYGVLEYSNPKNQPELWKQIINETDILFKEPLRSKLQKMFSEKVASTGQILLEFFKEADPYPNTEYNEYLKIFFIRTAAARDQFSSPSTARGYDDRGEIYVRLGQPTKIISSHKGIKGDVGWGLYPYEFWFYDNIHPDLYYTFIRLRGKSYFTRAAGPESVIGSFYDTRRAFSNRQNVGETAVLLRNELYSSLAGQHETFRARLTELSAQLSYAEALEYAQRHFAYEDKMHTARVDTLAPMIAVQ